MADEPEVCTCEEYESSEPHSCPFAEDVFGDDSEVCYCCPLCENECAMGI